jgi:uncharacterized protein YaiI (UPF0178 family)
MSPSETEQTPRPPDIYVDADGCPVKEEIYRAARKYGLNVYVVCNAPMRTPADGRVHLTVVGRGPDEADKWIAERAGPGDLVVTADLLLADRALKKGARVLDARGREFTTDSIGSLLATRDLMNDLRMAGAISCGPPPLEQKEKAKFSSKLHEAIRALLGL